MRHGLFALCLVALMAWPVAAHEVRPGYIELTETARDTYAIIWKQPVRSGAAPLWRALVYDLCFPKIAQG